MGDKTPTKRPAPAEYSEEYEVWKSFYTQVQAFIDNEAENVGSCVSKVLEGYEDICKNNFAAIANFHLLKRRFAIIEQGHMAIILPGLEPGDLICVISGAFSPYILR